MIQGTRKSSPTISVVLMLLAALPASAQEKRQQVGAAAYEGWRQYSVHCARCHGQDVLGNPVAANLLESTKPGGPTAEQGAFSKVVAEGRPNRGMPGFGKVLTASQIEAIYQYVSGRAEGTIPPGRPRRAGG